MSRIGSLIVSLEANVARYLSELARARQQTDIAMQSIRGAAGTALGALEALGVGVSVGAFAVMIKGSIDAADNLRDMSQKTAVAVEDLAGLGFAAGQAGGDLESVGAAAGKLNKAIASAASGNKEVGAAFGALGIDVTDATGRLKKADAVMAEVADQFEQFEDGPEKAALAVALFGKAGTDMIPLLNDGGKALRENSDYAKKYGGATRELSDASDNFNDTMGRLQVQQKGFVNNMTASLLPILQRVADETLGAAEQADKFSLASEVVKTTLETFVIVGSEVVFTFKAVGTEIGGIAAQLAALASGDIKGFTAISEAMRADAEVARKEHEDFIAYILNPTAMPAGPDPFGPNPTEKAKPRAPRLPGSSDESDKAALAKKLLDGKLKTLEANLTKEQDVARYHEQYMAELREQGLIDYQVLADYKQRAASDGLAVTIQVYDAEIAELERYKAAADKAAERQDTQNKIDELGAKKNKARQDALQASSLATLGLSKAQGELNIQMREWGIQQGQAASQLQFEVDMMGKSTLEVARLAGARKIELDIEERIRLAKEKGAITDESIARYRRDGAAHAAEVNKISIQAAGRQVGLDQRNPAEVEIERHDNVIKTLRANLDEKFVTTAEGNRMIEEENRRHNDALTSMQLSSAQNMLGITQSSAGELYSALQSAGMEQTALGKAMFYAQKAIQVASIIVNANVAAAAAEAGMIAAASATAAVSGPAGPGIIAGGITAGAAYAMAIRSMGYASAGIVAGTAIASAEGGYDIPAGVNPKTQLHEREMVLPKAQADVIRGLAARGGANTGAPVINQTLNIAIDSRTDQAQVRQLVSNAIAQGNANLVDRLQRAGVI